MIMALTPPSTETRHKSGRLRVMIGWLAIVFPALFLLVVGLRLDEQTRPVSLFGLMVSAILGAIWAAVWFASASLARSDRRTMFGTGASLSLAGSILMGNATDQLLAAVLTYGVIAMVVVFTISARHTAAPARRT